MITRMSCSITSRPTSKASLIAASAPTSSSDSPSSSPAAGSSSRRKSGRGRERPGDREPPLLAVRQRAAASPRARCSRPTRSRISQPSARACAPRSTGGDRRGFDVLEDRERGEQPDVLEGAHDAGARDLGGRPGRDVLAVEHDRPPVVAAGSRRARSRASSCLPRSGRSARGSPPFAASGRRRRRPSPPGCEPGCPAPRGIRRRERLSRAQRHFEAGHAASLARSPPTTCVARHARPRFVKMCAWTRERFSCSSARCCLRASWWRSARRGRGCRCWSRSWRSGCCSGRTGPAGSSSTMPSSRARSASSGSR